MQRTLLALALIVTAGASYAQTMPTAEPSDPYGRPLIGRNDWVRQPGDQAGPGGNPNMAAVPMPQVAPRQMDRMPAQSGPRGAAMKDEFGFRYDAQGNRLDARGNIISPQTR